MVWNIKLKCKCGSVLISNPPWPNNNTSETGSAYSICGVSPQRLTESRGPRGTEPKQDVDDDTWFPLMNETQVDTKSVRREIVWDRTVWTSSRSAPHYCAISNFPRRDVWTATCELVVKADKQTQLKVRSLRISSFILHKYLSDCMCPCAVFFTSTSTCLYTHTEKRIRLHFVVEWSSLSYKATCCCFWASCQDNMTGSEVCGKLT